MADHKQGCPALPGYGHAPEACTCGAEPTESFDAVLAELRRHESLLGSYLIDNLQSAHEAEVAELRADAGKWRAYAEGRGAADDSHACRRCGHAYTPEAGESEDCPNCGFDGIDTKDSAHEA